MSVGKTCDVKAVSIKASINSSFPCFNQRKADLLTPAFLASIKGKPAVNLVHFRILKKRNQPTPSLLDQFRKDRELQNRLTENKIGRSFKISALKAERE